MTSFMMKARNALLILVRPNFSDVSSSQAIVDMDTWVNQMYTLSQDYEEYSASLQSSDAWALMTTQDRAATKNILRQIKEVVRGVSRQVDTIPQKHW